jgi:hypothetical protein
MLNDWFLHSEWEKAWFLPKNSQNTSKYPAYFDVKDLFSKTKITDGLFWK